MSQERSGVALGFGYFAAIVMIVGGAFEALQGLSAIIKSAYYVVGGNYVYKVDVTTWGWVHLILGVVILAAGIALLSGQLWARIVGIIVAVLIAIANFMWLPYYPVWSIIIIAICVLVIWALTVHGHDIEKDAAGA